MKKYGLTMDESGVKKGLELAKSQREMKGAMEGMKMTIGQALLPALASITGAITPIIGFFAQLLSSTPALKYVIVGLAAALGGLVVFTTIAAAIGVILPMLPLLAAGFTAVWAAITGPVGLVVIGIIALVAAFTILYNKVGWFHDAVDAVFGAIKSAVSTAFNAIVDAAKFAFNWIKGNWPLLLGILTGPFGLAIALIVTHFGTIKKVASDAFSTVSRLASDAWNGMTKGVDAAVQTIINLINKIPDAAKSVVDKVTGFFGGIGDAVSGAASKLNPVSDLKGLLKGQHGLVMPGGGGLALVGEAGPELLQLPGGARVSPLAAGTSPPVDLAGAGFGEIHVHLDVDGRELAHVLARETADRQAMR
jgi:phage-related protein